MMRLRNNLIMDNFIEEKLLDFFRQFTQKRISNATTINNDLELLASEVPMILTFFQKEFQIDIREEDLMPFFLEEFNVPFKYTYYKLFRPEKLRRPPLTISHLIKVCEKGHWFLP